MEVRMIFTKGKRFAALSLLLAVVFLTPLARADQLILKNGREYSGKFVRGDASVVEFRSGGKIESFRTLDIAQIIFKEPELATQPPGSGIQAPVPQGTPQVVQDQPPVRQVPPQVAGPSVT